MSRTGAATVLALLGCLLAGPAIAAYSLDHQLADQDRYVQAVTPIAGNPAVRQELADRISETAAAKLTPGDLQLPESARRLLHSAVTKFVESDSFRTGWAAANRTAQPEVIKMLRDEPSSLRIVDDTVLLDLGVVADRIKSRLIDEDVPFARQLPDVDASVRLFSRPAIRQAIPAFALLQDLSVILPIIVVALLVLSLAISARRRQTLIVTGLGLVVSMLLVVLYQSISRGQLTARSQSPELAGAFYDAFTSNLTTLLWVAFGIGVVAAVGGLAAMAAMRGRNRGGTVLGRD
ncbi:hypothetical protein JOF56_004957 [Kibdelosporangium banguiense]|uniref:Integral membrane protein n=1 Tax=Kibdelosporangium banguiense TaxID=1365924 RepID=A0ABS4TJH8_9PSEU|nr:hypothetical protein [Kibdelosporangium banguiense]MBP2324572.1 hypothetical protein [Kibdelosporangium banguiense]